MNDPQRMALADKVEVRHDPDITARGPAFRHMVRVELHLVNGDKLVRTVEAPRGSEHKFATEGEVVEKFEKLARHVFPARQVKALRDAVLGLERLDDSSALAALLARK